MQVNEILTIGARLKQERERLGMSQGRLAEAIGLKSKQAQSNYERDVSDPPNDYWKKASKLGLDVAYILTGTRSGQAAQVADLKSEAPAPYLVRGRGAPPEGDELMDTLELLRDTASRAIELLRKERGDG
jgi:transcriptional regulator with XRE-family HTH domain